MEQNIDGKNVINHRQYIPLQSDCSHFLVSFLSFFTIHVLFILQWYNEERIINGHPEDVITAGNSFNYQFTVNQRAGLSWYHPHPDGATARQAFQGLAGLFIMNDAEEAPLNLPSGIYEIPLVIQDKRFASSGIKYNPSMGKVMSGFMGETIIVNGEASPIAEVATRFYRLRILNGSNARIYNLALNNNSDLIIIGNDGGLFNLVP